MLKEFKPTILFLVKFFVIFLALSAMYGQYIKSYDTADPPQTDPITRFVTYNCVGAGNMMGYETMVLENDHLNYRVEDETTFDGLLMDGMNAISVEEGCNGISIMLLFVAFVIAFGGKLLNLVIFIPAGLLFIHLANIGRLMLLSLLNVEMGGQAFHFFHKYFFTASIYLAVLLLWYLWAVKFSGKTTAKKTKEA